MAECTATTLMINDYDDNNNNNNNFSSTLRDMIERVFNYTLTYSRKEG